MVQSQSITKREIEIPVKARHTRNPGTFLRELVGRSDFIYVADSKLFTGKNMKYIRDNEGRFITVLLQSRREDDTGQVQVSAMVGEKARTVEDRL
jgi:hypothetical protein